MMPQIANVKPAGVTNVGYMLETSALVMPFRRVVLPASPFTTSMAMKATIFIA
jgi:hypothetical protein